MKIANKRQIIKGRLCRWQSFIVRVKMVLINVPGSWGVNEKSSWVDQILYFILYSQHLSVWWPDEPIHYAHHTFGLWLRGGRSRNGHGCTQVNKLAIRSFSRSFVNSLCNGLKVLSLLGGWLFWYCPQEWCVVDDKIYSMIRSCWKYIWRCRYVINGAR